MTNKTSLKKLFKIIDGIIEETKPTIDYVDYFDYFQFDYSDQEKAKQFLNVYNSIDKDLLNKWVVRLEIEKIDIDWIIYRLFLNQNAVDLMVKYGL